MPDWLGYEGTKVMTRGGALSFEAARTFVRTLKLGSMKEWQGYSKSGKRPPDIPGSPQQTYRDDGWISYPDWLGYEGSAVANGGALPFEAARTFARTLKLGSKKEWEEYRKKRPSNIPCDPQQVYRDAGWVSMPDWLGYEGTKVMTKGGGGALPFEAARAFVRTLKLGGVKEWKEYSKSGKRPSNIPGSPHKVYRDAGWVSMPDWLGYGG
jgi:hypothetical protein